MVTLDQLAHPHTFTVSRSIDKSEVGNVAEITRMEIADQLARFLAKKRISTSVDGESVNLSLRVVVLTPDELATLVEGIVQATKKEGEPYVGNDAS